MHITNQEKSLQMPICRHVSQKAVYGRKEKAVFSCRFEQAVELIRSMRLKFWGCTSEAKIWICSGSCESSIPQRRKSFSPGTTGTSGMGPQEMAPRFLRVQGVTMLSTFS